MCNVQLDFIWTNVKLTVTLQTDWDNNVNLVVTNFICYSFGGNGPI